MARLAKSSIVITIRRIDTPELSKIVTGVVVDIGATVSAMPADVVRELGIKLPEKRKILADYWPVGGASGWLCFD